MDSNAPPTPLRSTLAERVAIVLGLNLVFLPVLHFSNSAYRYFDGYFTMAYEEVEHSVEPRFPGIRVVLAATDSESTSTPPAVLGISLHWLWLVIGLSVVLAASFLPPRKGAHAFELGLIGWMRAACIVNIAACLAIVILDTVVRCAAIRFGIELTAYRDQASIAMPAPDIIGNVGNRFGPIDTAVLKVIVGAESTPTGKLIFVGISNWILALVGVVVIAITLLRGPLRRRRRNRSGCCVVCGYDLRGSPTNVCPECGAVGYATGDRSGSDH